MPGFRSAPTVSRALRNGSGFPLKALLIALPAGFLLAALGLVGLAWVASGQLMPGQPLRIAATEMQALQLEGVREGKAIAVRGLDPNPGRQAYLAERGLGFLSLGPTQLDVSGYAFVHCDCSRRSEEISVRFLWQQAGTADSEGLRAMPFGPAGSYARLDGDPNWGGTLFELGVVLEGPLDSQAMIEAIELYVDSAWIRVRWHLSSWLSPEPWSLRSINSLALDPEAGIPLSLAVLAGALVAAILFLLLTRGAGRRSRLCGLAAILALSWLVLDLRWTIDQAAQARLTWQGFAGKDVEERVLSEPYGPIVDLARSIREAGGNERNTVFLISDNPDSRFLIERLTFHLLPDNPFNLGARFWLLRRHAAPGDFVVVLENPAGVSHDRARGILEWAGRGRICARRVLDEGFAQVYRSCSPHP